VILLDTNVISELMKRPTDPNVAHWFQTHDPRCFLPSPALAEMAFGIARLPHGTRRRELEAKLSEWRLRYAKRTLSFTGTTAMIYGTVMAEALASGHNMSVVDAQIAAIAVEHGTTLATRNLRDFKVTSVSLTNPWD
jgi:predicted nucleic acid-binding protein